MVGYEWHKDSNALSKGAAFTAGEVQVAAAAATLFEQVHAAARARLEFKRQLIVALSEKNCLSPVNLSR